MKDVRASFAASSLAAVVLAASVVCTNQAAAWCQSCTVTRAFPTCAQPCFCPTDTDPDARFIAWQRPCIDYAIDEGSMDLPLADVEAVFERSFAAWTEADCAGGPLALQVRRRAEPSQCDVPEFVSGGGNVNAMGFVDDWSIRGHAPAAYALTTTWFRRSTGEIVDADMELNQEDWEFAICTDGDCGRAIDLENTVTHELGHFFGLAHTEALEDATMWACADPGETFKRDLSDDDIEGICAIYAEGFDAECDFEPEGGFDPSCSTVRETGCGCIAAGRGEAGPFGLLFTATVLAVGRMRRRRRHR